MVLKARQIAHRTTCNRKSIVDIVRTSIGTYLSSIINLVDMLAAYKEQLVQVTH